MAVSVHDLELPEVELIDLERAEALAVLAEAREGHWLARTPMGYMVTRHEDVTAILRDRRFLSALSLITQMQGVDDSRFMSRRQPIDPLGRRRGTRPPPPARRAGVHAEVGRSAPPVHARRHQRTRRQSRARTVNASSSKTSASRIRSRSSASCSARRRRIGSSSRTGRATSSASSTTTSKTTWPRIDAASDELDAYVRAMIDERRSQPADDLLSDLIAIEEEGDRLDTDDLVGLAEAVLMAGHRHHPQSTRVQRRAVHRASGPVGDAGGATRAGEAGGRGEHAFLGAVRGHDAHRRRGRRVPRRGVPCRARSWPRA